MYDPNSDQNTVRVIGDCELAQQDTTEHEPSNEWFENYISNLKYSETAIKNVNDQCVEISKIINESVLLYDNDKVWPDGRLRKGMVVGSDTIRKTASMMGVIGNCLDNGTRVVVLLSGTKTSLWHQTLSRVYDELDIRQSSMKKSKIRLMLPRLYVKDRAVSKIDYDTQLHSIKSSLEDDDKVLVFIIPKIVDHIINLATALHMAYDQIDLQPTHMLVIDDESDDASILTSKKENAVPYAITRLWAGVGKSKHFETTAFENLFCTYLAYTPTPQANIQQHEVNPLIPSDFMFVIKTPSIEDSSITYNEPKGIKNQYTGGSVFYEQDFSQYAPSTNFIQPLVLNNDGSINLANGLMSYVVGSAINMIRSEKSTPF